jgi:8-oxo-dGTP pyrophosphatase MutT (NUDIX family)
MDANPLPWLRWVRTLQTIGQAGLTWTEDEYDRDRFRQVQRVAAEIAAGIAGLPTQAIADAFAADTGHPTPKVDVRGGVLRRDGRILLVRERVDGLWTLPGGWADPGDTPSATIAREVREESGYAVRATRLVALHRSTTPTRPSRPSSTEADERRRAVDILHRPAVAARDRPGRSGAR